MQTSHEKKTFRCKKRVDFQQAKGNENIKKMLLVVNFSLDAPLHKCPYLS